MSGQGRASGTGPESRCRHQRPSLSTCSLNTSDLMSQCICKVPFGWVRTDLRQALSSQLKGTSYVIGAAQISLQAKGRG